MQSNYGKFITIEGCDGVGKSTQIELLKEYCKKNDIDAVFSREPGGVRISEQIRKIILDVDNKMNPATEFLLFTAARIEHLEQVIIPALKAGKVVFCDRFIHSTIAYQGYGRGLEVFIMEFMHEQLFKNTPIDLTIFLDLPPTESFARKGGQDKTDRLDSEGILFHNRVYDGFCAMAKTDSRIKRIDASKSKEEVFDDIVKVLKKV